LTVTLGDPDSTGLQDSLVKGKWVYLCHFQLTAMALGGSPNEAATWGGSQVTYVGLDGVTYIAQDAPAKAFIGGNPGILTGTTETGQPFTARWYQPFNFSVSLYYTTPQTALDSATYAFSCM
jgi:hypothetical protein